MGKFSSEARCTVEYFWYLTFGKVSKVLSKFQSFEYMSSQSHINEIQYSLCCCVFLQSTHCEDIILRGEHNRTQYNLYCGEL